MTATPYATRVAVRLRELRNARGWAVADVAARIGVTPNSLYKYETAVRELPLWLIPVVGRVYGYGTAHGWLPR